ncbi:MAG: hypothetical protein U1F43_07580 [Myxococcota bacterium]
MALLVLALGLLAGRLLRFEPAPASATSGRSGVAGMGAAARALGVTLALVAAAAALGWLPLPMVDGDLVPPEARASFGVGALGLAPILTASLLVALVVALVPRLRRLRGGTFLARRALAPAWLATTLALAALQALPIATLYRQLAAGYGVDPGLAGGFALMGCLVLALLTLWGAAALISQHGVGHGLAVLLTGLTAVGLARGESPIDARVCVLGAALGLLTLLLASRGVRVAPDVVRRLPLAGFTPLDLGTALLTLVALLPPLAALADAIASMGLALEVAVMAALGLAIAWLLQRPRSLAGLGPATALSVALIAAVAAAKKADLSGAGAVATLAFLPVLLAARGGELAARARLGALVRVTSTADVDRAGRLLELLAAAGVPAALRGVRTRALLRFMGPWLPIEVLVPAPDRERAVAVLRAEAEADVVGAF